MHGDHECLEEASMIPGSREAATNRGPNNQRNKTLMCSFCCVDVTRTGWCPGWLFCCTCARVGRRCQVVPRTKCGAMVVCNWLLYCTLIALMLLLLIAFWSCLVLPTSHLGVSFLPAPTNQPLAQARAAAGIVSVLSYNVFLRLALVCDAATCAQDDFKEARMRGLLARADRFDVLLLQEAWLVLDLGRKKRLVDLARAMGFHYYVRARNPWGQFNDAMLLILSRHPLTNPEEWSYTDTSEGQKGAIYAQVRVNGLATCALDVVTTHMQSGSTPYDLAIQAAQQVELGAFVRRKHRAGVPLVLTGDFNTDGRTSTSDGFPGPLYAALRRHLDLDAHFNVTDVVQLGTGGLVPVTYLAHTASTSNLLQADIHWNTSLGEGLDYAFLVDDRPSKISSMGGARRVDLIEGTAVVDSMLVQGQPFTTLSDHLAVHFRVQCA